MPLSTLPTILGTLSALSIAYSVAWFAFLDPLRHIPGPYYTRVSSIWLGVQCRLYRRSRKVHELHKQYGDVVRISVNHVSINRPDAIQELYHHHREYQKGSWYKLFERPKPALFTTFDPDVHAEQRKNLSPAFSARALREFEPTMDKYYLAWKKCVLGLFGNKTTIKIDLNEWVSFLAFDLIAEFAFGTPFGFIEKGKDFLDLITSMTQFGFITNALAVLPFWIRPYMPWLPFDSFWRESVTSILKLQQLTERSCKARIAHDDDSKRDLLSYMLAAKSEGGESLPFDWISSHATSVIFAGSDSTATSVLHCVDYISRDNDLQKKLQGEIDAIYPGVPFDDWVPSHMDNQKLSFLSAVVHEVLRLRPTAGLGWERFTPNKATIFGGVTIPPNTCMSVPTYSIHRKPEIYPDPESFRPERWLEEGTSEQYKYFNIFSQGPRSCIGQNFAWMEMLKTLVLLFKMFSIKRMAEGESEMREGQFLKMMECLVVMEPRY